MTNNITNGTGVTRSFRERITLVPNALISDPNISSNAVRLYAFLASFDNPNAVTWGQVKEQTGIRKVAAVKAVAELEKKGYIK